MNPIRKWATLASLAVSIIGSRAEGSNVSYHCAGSYLLEAMWQSSNFSGFTNAGGFRVLFDDCKWRIILQPEPEDNPGYPTMVYKDLEAAFDGESIFELTVGVLPSGFSDKFSHNGQIVNGPVPQRIDQRIQYIWLGLASGCFFNNNSPGYLRPLALRPEDEKHHDNFRLVATDWGYFGTRTTTADIPDWIAYKGAEHYKGTVSNDDGDPHKGETNVLLNVSKRIHVGNIDLPQAFQVTQFFGNKPTLKITCMVKYADNASTNSLSIPALSSETILLDRRLTNQQPFVAVRFLAKRWPTIADSEKAYERQISFNQLRLNLPSEDQKTKRYVVIGLVVSSVVAFLFLWRQLRN